MKQLNVRKDCTARVFKANMIIPQVDSVDDDGVADFEIPTVCPVCGGATKVTKDNDSEVLVCANPNCKGKLLGKCYTFVSKQGMDIDGLGESSLETYINLGIINKLSDIFRLRDHYYFIGNLEGWSNYSADKLMNAIEASRDVSLEKFIAALSIPNIGLASAKTIAKHFDYNIGEFHDAITGNYAWSLIDGFGEKTEQDIYDWYHDNKEELEELLSYVRIKSPAVQVPIVTDSPISGKTFCITGTFNSGKREALKTKIEQLGGIFVDGVTKKTDILFVGDKAGSKLKKAQDLNIIIYDESKLMELLEAN
jgi:DNA ligase (NAD+)